MWTLAVRKHAKLDIVPKDEYERLQKAHEAVNEASSKFNIDLSDVREQLTKRIRKIEILEASNAGLESNLSASIAQQVKDAQVISDLARENEVLKQEVESLKLAAQPRKRSARLVKE